MVLGGTKGVSDTFKAVNDGASHIVSRIELVLAASAVMSLVHAAVQDWVTQSAVLGLHINLGAQAVSLALRKKNESELSSSRKTIEKFVGYKFGSSQVALNSLMLRPYV